MHDRSPLAPEKFPKLADIEGVRLATARAGYKSWDRADMLLGEFAEGTVVAGLTTTSKCPSPEVEWCRSALPQGKARALVVNAGNSGPFKLDSEKPDPDVIAPTNDFEPQRGDDLNETERLFN